MSNQNIQKFNLIVPKSARYFTIGNPSGKVKEVWFVLHGYGQLANYFIKHFECITSDERFIIAPEGLSRFYLDANMYERVGASWMTKEDRLHDIEDQKVFLDQVYKEVMEEITHPVKMVMLGFSQGTATAWRWLNETNLHVDHLIIWAGSIPRELERIKKLTNNTKLTLVYGTEDPFITKEKVEEIKNILEDVTFPCQIKEFVGGHTINEDLLKEIAG